MTRLGILNYTLSLPSSPASVALGELVIAAGVAGHATTLSFCDFDAPVLSELWKYFSRFAGTDDVHHVRGQSDVRKLANRAAELRLVFVHVPRLHNPAAWAIHLAIPSDGEQASLPAMLSRFAPDDVDEEPGATLTVRGSDREYASIDQWPSIGERLIPDWSTVSTNEVPVEVEPLVSRVFSAWNGSSRRRFRDRQVVRGLMAGACLLRSFHEEDPGNGGLTANLDDYGQVRALLQSPIVNSAEETFDPLAVDMVARANIYLSIRYGPDQSERNPFYCNEYDYHTQNAGGRPRPDLITRREIGNLGDTRSATVRKLLSYLQRQSDGYEQFLRLGLTRRPPGQNAWSTASTDSLVGFLRSWTTKQTRTHFDRLRRENLITAEREHTNGPWRYVLPEELATANSAFRALPSPDELAGDGI